jgi:GDP-L-fucose synthase
MTKQVDWSTARVVVTGGSGFLGRHVIEGLHARGVTPDRLFVPRSKDFDLTEADACRRLYAEAFPGHKVDCRHPPRGRGRRHRRQPREPGPLLLRQHGHGPAPHRAGPKGRASPTAAASSCQVGTICAYPKFTPVPFKEENLWNGYPEETNAPYGVAKKAAWQMLDAYKLQYGMKSSYVLPVNLYGPGTTSTSTPAM